jgi:uncharacterized membrane protein YidH (DUF202 family)
MAFGDIPGRRVRGGHLVADEKKRRIAMPLIHVVIVLVVVGVILWLINTYLPMDAKIKTILNVVIVIAVILWLLSAFGVIGALHDIKVGR